MTSSIVTSVAKTLGNLSLIELHYLYDVKDKVERLKNELEWMQCYLIDAETPQEDQDQVTRKNMSDLRESAYEAEDILDKYLGGVSHPLKDGIWNALKWFCHLLHIYEVRILQNLGSKIDELTEKMAGHRGSMVYPSPNNTRRLDANNDVRHTHEVVVGLKEDVDTMVNKLIGETVNVVGICGIGGLGKTTLARNVFTHQRTKQHFDCTAWVYVSRQVNKINIFKAILNGLIRRPDERDEIKELGEEELPGKISEILQERKCLVILDDIWTVAAWQLLKPAFESIGASAISKSKILLTTHDQRILDAVKIHGIHSHNLAPLNEEDSWDLFLLKAFPRGNIEVDPEMEALGKAMVKHCKGLPLAIVALAGILSKKRTSWKIVQENISQYLTRYNVDGEAENDLRWLELSYFDLPYYLKPCFLYLGHFPEDYEIKANRLYHFWDAEGFLSTGDKLFEEETSLEMGERYLEELIQRSLVEVGERRSNGRIKSCRVHDIMRDICLKKCKDVCFLDTLEVDGNLDLASILVDPTVQKRKRRCAVFVKGDFVASRSPAAEEAEYLRALFIFSDKYRFDKKVISDIKKFFPLVRVLDLQGEVVGVIPNVVRELIHLRYLSLRNLSCDGVYLTSGFWNLEYLVTLDLRFLTHAGTTDFPMVPNKFKEMKSLRHLYLPRNFWVEGGEKLSFRADQMETLKNFNAEYCQVEDLMEMKRLRIFTLSASCSIESDEVLEGLSKSVIKSGRLMKTLHLKVSLLYWSSASHLSSLLNGLTKLSLDGNPWDKITSGIFPRSLTHLRLESYRWTTEVCSALSSLPNLEYLLLLWVDLESTGYIMRFPATNSSFPRLKTLHIAGVRESWEWEVEDGALPSIQTLVLYNVKKLVKIPSNLPESLCLQSTDSISGETAYNKVPFTADPDKLRA